MGAAAEGEMRSLFLPEKGGKIFPFASRMPRKPPNANHWVGKIWLQQESEELVARDIKINNKIFF